MTLHRSPESFRNFNVPVKPLQRWTAEETRAIENWWLKSMPNAGLRKSMVQYKPDGTKDQTFSQYRRELNAALQEWVTRDELASIAGNNRAAASSFLRNHRRFERYETQVLQGDTYYRFTDAAKAQGYRFTDPSKVLLGALDEWISAKALSAKIDADISFVMVEIKPLVKDRLVLRRRMAGGVYHYVKGVRT